MKKLTKEDIENLSYKDITYLLLKEEKKGLNTLELFTRIVDLLELPRAIVDKKIGDYYTDLTKDKRFSFIDGKWDLRERYPSDKVIINVEDEDEDEEEQEEEVEQEEGESDFDTEEDVENEFEDDDSDGLEDLVVIDEEDLDEQ